MFIGYQKIDRWMQGYHLQGYTYYWLQPPPNLPRRGGTDTLGCLISNGLPISESNLHLQGYWLQPPPSLPRRGGTDTLGCLILNGLPTNKSNLHLPYGGEREGADVQKQSNQSLTLGKVRIGCPLGMVRMSHPYGEG